MSQDVMPIPLGSGMFSVNCYLVRTGQDFVLVDTGMRRHRSQLEAKLRAAGCLPGRLTLILLTHGDHDHIGNAAYLRECFASPVAMHQGDWAMAATGDMFAGRRAPNRVARTVLSLLFRSPIADRFQPDVQVDEATDLAAHGLAGARLFILRGHSAGSIGLLLADGSLLCGDVLENRTRSKLGSIMDDVSSARQAVERLRSMNVGIVYPGHGRPFRFTDLAATDRS